MLKKYLYTFAVFFLLGIIYLLTLLPIQMVRANLESDQYMLALITWFGLVLISLGPVLTVLIKKIWFFPGKGEPVAMKLLQSLIREVNDMKAPVRTHNKRKRMIVNWRHDDPEWCERLDISGIKRLYELVLSFDDDTKTVTMSDRTRFVDFDLCPVRIKTGLFSRPKPFFNVKTGEKWGVENYDDSAPSDFTFSPGEIKSPVMGTILKNGWNVRFSLL